MLSTPRRGHRNEDPGSKPRSGLRSDIDLRSTAGFTLVELLVVVIIIGILAAIAVPIFMNQRAKAADAAVKSDLRNAATVVQTFLADGHTWADLRAMSGMTNDLNMSRPDGTSPWNDVEGLPTYTWSEGSGVNLTVLRNPTADWTNPHAEGDFCLQGRSVRSTWDYAVGDGAANYHRLLFFDPQLGGIATVHEIARAVDDGVPTSCSGFANRWKVHHPGGY